MIYGVDVDVKQAQLAGHGGDDCVNRIKIFLLRHILYKRLFKIKSKQGEAAAAAVAAGQDAEPESYTLSTQS